MNGTDLTGLFSLCHGCHEAATFGLTGRRPPDEVSQMAAGLPPTRESGKATPKDRKPKTHRGPMTIQEIRAASFEYATGQRK